LARIDLPPQAINGTIVGTNGSCNFYSNNSSNSNTIVQQQQPQPSCSNASVQDVTDDFIVVNSSSNYRTNETVNDVPLDHRLPSPEEQCQIIALK
jgi:hypothetical protein